MHLFYIFILVKCILCCSDSSDTHIRTYPIQTYVDLCTKHWSLITNCFQTGHYSTLSLNIRVVTPEVIVPSAPPLENLIIDDDVPLQSGSTESSFADSSSSTTENLSKKTYNEGSSNGASSCIICYEAPIEGACVPCGHMAGCMSCLNEIKAKSWGCPVCRAKIELVLRLYAV